MKFLKFLKQKDMDNNEILENKFGKKDHQPFFEDMFWKALRGMNIGNGDEVDKSGELNLLKELKDNIEPSVKYPFTIFDVGANIGDYAKHVLEIFKDTNYLLYCFEPSKKTFEILNKNLGQNEKIQLNNLGLSEKEKKQILYSDNNGSGMASLVKRELSYRNIIMDQTEEVSLIDLDSYCKRNKIINIDLLKLDIEGFELDALKGASNMINNGRIKNIQFEFGGCNIDTRTYFKDFYFYLEKRYKIYRVLQDGVLEIENYHEYLEQFNTTNYYARIK